MLWDPHAAHSACLRAGRGVISEAPGEGVQLGKVFGCGDGHVVVGCADADQED